MLIGNRETLGFCLDWQKPEPGELEGLGWAGVILWVGGDPVWRADSPTILPVYWTWIDLVEHLAQIWGAIQYEECPPFGLTSKTPELLREQHLLEQVVGVSSDEVEDCIHHYQHRHDLAAGLMGISLSPVWILPEGNLIRVRSLQKEIWLPCDEVLQALDGFSLEILNRIGEDDSPRAIYAKRLWDQRQPSKEKVWRLRTGLSLAELREWTPPQVDMTEYWGSFRETPMMVAARMSQALDVPTRKLLIAAIAATGEYKTPVLDQLSDDIVSIKLAVKDRPPFEQGQIFAVWLRDRLHFELRPIDPQKLLTNWGVFVGDLPQLTPSVDAVACWSHGHGPAVLVNPTGKYSSSDNGRRATLAHEVAHLLLDRNTHLPAGEVFGGSTPLHLEQRARAFAAELLVPRAAAEQEVMRGAKLEVIVRELQHRFGASKELIYWQIRNGGSWTRLSLREKNIVENALKAQQRTGGSKRVNTFLST